MPSTFAQATRPLIIKTALPDSTFVVMSIEAREAISEVYRFEVDLMTENRDSVAFDRLLGQDASVALRRESGSVRHFSGIVCAVRQGENMIVAQDGRPHEYTRFRISIVPKLWLLAQQRRSRIFQHVTVPDILKTVLQETNVEFQLDAAQNTFNERDYCVQYRETDLNFALRLMEEEGIFFFFTHGESGHRMIVANSPMAHPELPGSFRFEPLAAQAGQEDRIWTWQKTQEIRPGKYVLRDFTFEMPDKNLEQTRPAQQTVQAGTVEHKLDAGGAASLEISDFPGGYAGRYDSVNKSGGDQSSDLGKIFTDGPNVVSMRMQAESASALRINGKSSATAFTPGSKFALTEHFSDNGPFVINSVTHRSRQSVVSDTNEEPFDYTNDFTCIPFALPFRPPRVTPIPVVHGTQSAMVVGPAGDEIFTDKYGRVKVQFRWDPTGLNDADSSCWIRVASTWAGKNWGAIHIPRVGQEVVVAFEEGDPNQPIIIGSVYNAANMPPYTLPDNMTQSGLKSQSTPGGSGYNEFRFEDKKDKEQVVFHAQKDLLSTIENDETRTVKHDRSTTVTGNESKTIQQGNQTITLNQGNQSTKLAMGNQSTSISLGKSETEAMQSIELKVGQSSIKLDQSGVTIQGLTVKIQGTIEVQMKSMMTQINGDVMLTAKGGIVMVN